MLVAVCVIVGRFGVGDGRALAARRDSERLLRVVAALGARRAVSRVIWAAVLAGGARRRGAGSSPGRWCRRRDRCARSPTSSSSRGRTAPGAPAPGRACGAGGGRSPPGSAAATSPRLAADLAVLERTPVRHMLDKLGYAVLFLALAPRAGDRVPAARRRRAGR